MAFCCCTCVYSLQQTGLMNPDNGWNIPNKDPNNIPRDFPISIDFKFEDSANCGGSSQQQQSGTLNGCITISSQSTIEFSVSGLTERMDSYYDQSEIHLEWSPDNWTRVVAISSEGLGEQCPMEFKSDTIQISLPAGRYRYQLRSDTRDPYFHVGMIHTFSINRI